MASVVQISDVIAEWQRRYQQGEYVSAEALCADCPELLAEVERRIEEIERSPAFVTQGIDTTGCVNATILETPSSEEARDTLVFQQRYSKLRFLARGGLGEIYVADDLELQRDVVLKFIRARHRHRTDCHLQFQV